MAGNCCNHCGTVEHLDETLGELKGTLTAVQKHLATQDVALATLQADFVTVRRIVYTSCGFVLLGFLGAVVKVAWTAWGL
jgi:hypothetical protein